MIKDSYNVLGVMSGTSLDGIDLAYCTFTKNEKWHFKIYRADTIPYDKSWYNNLKTAIDLNTNQLQVLDIEYSKYLGETINSFLLKHSISDIDFIASHGHTVLHRPDLGYTYQIGNTQELADTCEAKVICDFRVQDIELGGQGAPLVPIGDKLLFGDYNYCLNLGGFANVSFEDNGKRLAFDICPVNLVLNYFTSKIGGDYDDKGNLAASGQLNKKLLKQLNALSFYTSKPPKSLGLEWVLEKFLPIVNTFNLKTEDILRTLVEHMAIQITSIINLKNTKALVTGGGSFNDFLMSRIVDLSSTEIVLPEKVLIEYKEALIFGFLGVLRERKEVNCLRSVTGALRNHSSGKVLIPNTKINN